MYFIPEQKMRENDFAVSPVIGAILMVVVTVILAVAIAAIVYSFNSDTTEWPICAIIVQNVKETNEIVDFKITHSGGDRLVRGQWKLSIVPVGDPPVYRDSSTDFAVGDQITTYNLTSGTGNYIVTNSTAYTDGSSGKLIANEKYEVMIIVYPYKALVLDTIILAR